MLKDLDVTLVTSLKLENALYTCTSVIATHHDFEQHISLDPFDPLLNTRNQLHHTDTKNSRIDETNNKLTDNRMRDSLHVVPFPPSHLPSFPIPNSHNTHCVAGLAALRAAIGAQRRRRDAPMPLPARLGTIVVRSFVVRRCRCPV